MKLLSLIKKSLTFYWRSNIGVLLAVVVGTAVLSGSLFVGDSVKNSLREMVIKRLGSTELALMTGERFFTNELAERLADKLEAKTAPVLQVRGMVANSDGTSRANRVEMLGVDARFYEVISANNPFPEGEGSGVVINESLAKRIGVKVGDEVLVRIAKPALMSREIVLTPESDLSIAFRLKVTAVADQLQSGLFSLQANQISLLNAFVPLQWLQEKLGRHSQANMLLVGSDQEAEIGTKKANEAVKECLQLVDMGLEIRSDAKRDSLELRSNRIFIDSRIGDVAIESGKEAVGVLTYFVNRLRAVGKSTPYSMVTAMSGSDDKNSIVPMDMGDDEIIINQWLSDDLDVRAGDFIEVDYFVISSGRTLTENTAKFRVRAVVPLEGLAGDPDLMPDFPGLAEMDNCRDWEPGIPIDLDKIRDKDQEYWDSFGGTPKAFITLKAGQKIWANRYGNLTAVRYPLNENSREKLRKNILSRIDPAVSGLYFQPVRSLGVRASNEGTDFGQLFVGFSMFIIAAALVLLGLLFVFGVEKRCGEIGTLLAVGFEEKNIKSMFLTEAIVLTLVGTVFGIVTGLLYTNAMIYGLGNIWRKAVSNSQIAFHVESTTVLKAALIAVAVCVAAIWFAFREQLRKSVRQLLDKNIEWQFLATKSLSKGRLALFLSGFFAVAAIIFLILTGRGDDGISAGVFFGVGGLLLISSIALTGALLKIFASIKIGPAVSIAALALRNSLRRNGRSLAVVAMLACGVFIVIAVGANKRDPLADMQTPQSAAGGFTLMGESAIGVLHDLSSKSGRKSIDLNTKDMKDIEIVQLRVHDGDDASCFNLNRAQQPRLFGVEPKRFQQRKSFSFKRIIEGNKSTGWNLLNLNLGDDVIAAIGDEATVKWGLGKSVGDEIVYSNDNGKKFRVRIVAILKNSVLQGSLLIAEDDFIRHFPTEAGYRLFLVDTPEEKTKSVSETLSTRLKDFGLEVTTTAQKLTAFSAVENSYLSIFQLLGSFGLILGSIGLGVVVGRNVLDRTGELAMLRAIGFNRKALKLMVFYEHVGLMFLGLFLGTITALIAIFPVLKESAAQVPYLSLTLSIIAIAISGVIWIWFGTSIALSGKIIDGLRSE